jgi:hypothetical protein
VYNLRFDESGRTNYTVSYKVELQKQKRSFLSKTLGAIGRIFSGDEKAGITTSYTSQGDQPDTEEYLSLDMSKLPEGIAELKLIVQDNITSENAEQTIQLQLEK